MKRVRKVASVVYRTFLEKEPLVTNLVLIVFTLAIALSMQTGFVWTADATEKFALTATPPTLVGKMSILEDQEQIYGVQLMTLQERAAFRAKMSAVKTLEEREQIRNENHQVMQNRAKSHGLPLPDQVPAGKQKYEPRQGDEEPGRWYGVR